jgi:hypothetical protein
MPAYRPAPDEQVVSAEQYAQGYLERNGLVIKKRPYDLIRRLPDGNYVVRSPAPAKS